MAEAEDTRKTTLERELADLKEQLKFKPSKGLLDRSASLILEANGLGLALKTAELLKVLDKEDQDRINRLVQARASEARDQAIIQANNEEKRLKAATEAKIAALTNLSQEFKKDIEKEINTLSDISDRIAKGENIPQVELDQFVEQKNSRKAKHQALNNMHQEAHARDQEFKTEITRLKDVINDPNTPEHEIETARQKLPNIEKQHEQHAPIVKAAREAKTSADDLVNKKRDEKNLLIQDITQNIHKLPDSEPIKSKFLKFAQLIKEEPTTDINNKTLAINEASVNQTEIIELGDKVRNNLSHNHPIKIVKRNNNKMIPPPSRSTTNFKSPKGNSIG